MCPPYRKNKVFIGALADYPSKSTIQTSIVDRLKYIIGRDVFPISQVGDGSAYTENLVVCPGGKAQLRHGLAEHGF